MLLKKFIRIFTIYFLAGWILANPSAWAQTKKDKSVDWQNLDLTGSYYKKKTKKGIALWPIIVVGAAGAGAAGYFIYKGSLTKIEANDDQVSVSCQISTTIDVLANDRGDGMEIMEVFGQPEGIQIFITPNGNLTIDNVGNDNFSFNYRIRDKYDKEAEAAVQVEVKASQLQAVDDFYALEGGELLEGNVLENDEGILITVIDYSEFSSGTVQVNENGDFTLNASDTICGINSFTYTARDFCDNVDTATVYVESSDDEAPIITCPAEMTLECTDDTSPDSTGQPDVTDNCDTDPQISYTDNLFDGNCPSSKTLERTWTAVDISQNSSSCVQTIQIRDNTPPSITCPANISLTCGESLDPVATGRATATDNCTATEDIVIDYSDNLSGLTDCGGSTGTIIRTWIARDLCGNESQCVQNINISDDVPPVIFCPPNLIIGCDQGIDPETTSRPTASDNCTSAESINYTYVDNISGAIDCSASGVVSRTWTATDLCGNYNTCIQVINVETVPGPDITCPPEAGVSCDESTDPSLTGRPSAVSNCSKPGEVTFDYHDNSGGLSGCGNTGVLVRTWTATDPCNISSTCIQNINVVDNTPPVLNCPSDITISCDAGTDPANTGTATATDNCSAIGDVTVNYTDDFSGMNGCGNTGKILRTWTATDDCGNMTSCEQSITIQDTTPPVITCPADITVNCSASLDPAALGSATATDNCVSNGNITIEYSDNTSGLTGCGGTGTIIRTWTATDPCGNSSSCTQTINILDNVPPVINCPADITISCDQDLAPSVTGEPTVTDDCSADEDIAVSYSDDASGRTGCNGTGIVVRTWIARDACGNISQCTQDITIEDATPPIITCPADVNVNCEESTVPANTGNATATDNCTAVGEVDITYTDDVSGLTGCNGTGTLLRTWTATDLCGNQSHCIQNITIQDNTPPVITCPPNINIMCDESTDPSNTGQATATDNCTLEGNVLITYSDMVSGALDCSGDGRIDRTWTATDACGNIQTCVQTINVRSIGGPSINCPANITISCEDDNSPDNTGKPVGATACTLPGELTFTYSDDLTGLTGCNGSGIILRTWTVTDPCDLSNSCEQTITIEDATPPVLNCPAAVTISCDASRDPANTGGEATATDNCSADADIIIDFSDNDTGLTGCNGSGILVRTWTATDDCGNVSQCTQHITIEDTTPPAIACPANTAITCDQSIDPTITGSPVVSDNCTAVGNISVAYNDIIAGPLNCSGVSTITRTWSATDLCGNSSSCVQTITMNPVSGPAITCPGDVTISCTDPTDPANTGGSATATTDCNLPGEITISHTDDFAAACGNSGVITRIWSATDACGLSSNCVQRITIQDVTPPVLTIPSDVTIECGASTDPADTGQGTATDCSTVTVTHSDAAAGSCPEVITRTWTATDVCGNVSTADQTITIEDTTPPVITDCPSNLTLSCTDSTDPANTGTPTGTDDCSTVSFTPTDVETPGSCPAERTITRTWTATDDCGNSTTCTQVLTVVDNTAPTLTCPVDVTIGCTDNMDPSNTGNPSATDDCSSTGITFSYTDNDSHLDTISCTGYKLRTWVATDECGNASPGCDQRISIGASGGRIAATPDGEEQSQQSGGSVLTNGSEFQYFIDDFNAVRLDVINTITIFNTSPVLYYKDMELWRTNGSYSFRADVSYRRYFANTWIRPFAGAGFVLYKDIGPGVYSNDYLNGQIAYSGGDKYDYWIAYVSGGALIKINKFLYYELSLRMNKDFSTDPDALNIIKLRPSLNSRFLFLINTGQFK